MHPALVRSSAAKPRRLVVTTWGHSKTGRSHFALTFPDPIITINLDMGVEDIEWKFAGKELWRFDVPIPPKADVPACADILNRIEDVVADSCSTLAPDDGTLVIDTGSLLWQLVQKVELQPHREAKARRGDKDPSEVKVMQFQYADANLRISSIMRRVLEYPTVNAVFIHGPSEIYDSGGAATGVFQCHGWKGVHGVSQLSLHQYVRDNTFYGRFDVCRFDTSLEGIDLPNPTYDTLREMFLV